MLYKKVYFKDATSGLGEDLHNRNIFSGKRETTIWGDPGQEEQGLNSVYDTDTTVKFVADIVNEINQITQMK